MWSKYLCAFCNSHVVDVMTYCRYITLYCNLISKITFSTGQYKLGIRVEHTTQVIGDNLYLWGEIEVLSVHNNDDKK